MKNKIDSIVKKFRDNKKPYYFVSPTNFNLINIHRWVNKWININYVDCYNLNAPQCILPEKSSDFVFNSLEEINEYLLRNESIQKTIKEYGPGNIIYLFFNHELEKMASQLKLNIILPPNDLVKRIDSKIITTQIGNKAQVPSVPHFLGKVTSYKNLMMQAQENGLGDKLVIQAPYGDSGKTTFFVKSEADYDTYATQIEAEDSLKVMKEVCCIEGAVEACATAKGTFVGMLLSELIGFKEFTPYKGGWCGNEVYQEQFSDAIRSQIHEKTQKIGDTLYQEGYRGYFEVDFLIDADSSEIYLGEINPRLTGITAMTNMTSFCQKYFPLFLFHLLEYGDDEILIETDEFNKLSLQEGAIGCSSQLVVKSTYEQLRKIEKAPVSGVYELKGGHLVLLEEGSDPALKGEDPNHLFILRILKKDEYNYKGADKFIVFLNEKLTQNRGSELTPFAKNLVNAFDEIYQDRDLTEEEMALIKRFNAPSSIKGSI